jgi:hypothetical protein
MSPLDRHRTWSLRCWMQTCQPHSPDKLSLIHHPLQWSISR